MADSPTFAAGSFIVRGPRYDAYSKLRESKRRMKFVVPGDDPKPVLGEIEIPRPDFSPSPVKKTAKFRRSVASRIPSYSAVAQSVPDFSSALRKENRRPPKPATPPLPQAKVYGGAARAVGGKLGGSGEKRGGGVTRKSYACVEELKGLSAAVSLAIAGESRGGRGGGRRVVGRSSSALGIRQSVQY